MRFWNVSFRLAMKVSGEPMQMCRLSVVFVVCINDTQIAIGASFDTNPIVEMRRLRRVYANVCIRQSIRSSNKFHPNCLELLVLTALSRDECLDVQTY